MQNFAITAMAIAESVANSQKHFTSESLHPTSCHIIFKTTIISNKHFALRNSFIYQDMQRKTNKTSISIIRYFRCKWIRKKKKSFSCLLAINGSLSHSILKKKLNIYQQHGKYKIKSKVINF